jgi:hypothetical protein
MRHAVSGYFCHSEVYRAEPSIDPAIPWVSGLQGSHSEISNRKPYNFTIVFKCSFLGAAFHGSAFTDEKMPGSDNPTRNA